MKGVKLVIFQFNKQSTMSVSLVKFASLVELRLKIQMIGFIRFKIHCLTRYARQTKRFFRSLANQLNFRLSSTKKSLILPNYLTKYQKLDLIKQTKCFAIYHLKR